jgi:hypothetical protein
LTMGNLLSGNMKKVEKLKMAGGSTQPASTSRAPSPSFILPITPLALLDVTIPSSIDPSSLPFLRSFQLIAQTCHDIRLLLPQLSSLRVGFVRPLADFNHSIQESTSVTSLSLVIPRIVDLDDASRIQTFSHGI